MSRLAAFLSVHRLLRWAQAAYRRAHGKAPTQLPGEWPEKGDVMIEKVLGLFTGPASQKSPLWGLLGVLIGVAGLMGATIPGLPVMDEKASMEMIYLGAGVMFLAWRVKKSGPDK